MALMTDSFVRTDTTNAIGTPDVGPAWVQSAGTWGINSNQGYCSAVSGDSYCGADLSQADVDITFKLPTQGTSAGHFARFSNTSNNFVCIWVGGSTLYKKVAGSYTQIGTNAGTLGATQVAEHTMTGNAHNVLMDGASQFTATESFNNTATAHGLFTNGNGATRWTAWNVNSNAVAASPTPYQNPYVQVLAQ